MHSGHQTTLVLRSKTLIVGDACVGKTALTQMFYTSGSNYPKSYMMTVGAEFCVKTVKIPDRATEVELYMFDCGGQSILNQREWGTKYWQNATNIALVYDVTNRESFQSCTKWLQRVQEALGRPLTGVLIANKVDTRESGRAVVEESDGRALAKTLGLEYFETSAETSSEVDAPFHYIANLFHSKYEDAVSRAASALF